MSTTTATAAATTTTSVTDAGSGTAQTSAGISIVAFFTALSTSLIIFGVQMGFFLLLRNKLARIFKPKTYLVPERERMDPPPASPWGLLLSLLRTSDREIIKKCGLDAYFFLRYLQMLLLIFVPISLVVIPILVPVNYIDGLGHSLGAQNASATNQSIPTGLDTIAWGNVKPVHSKRRWAHLVLAVLVVVWVCYVTFVELRIYIKIRQDYLTSAEHRLRASANTVLVSSIPNKWLTESALRGLFDVFPGGIKNIWLTRDFTKLLDKVHKRDEIHAQLENAESQLVRAAKKRQLKQRAAEEKKARKKSKATHVTKAERDQRSQEEDARAKRMAQGPGGLSSGTREVLQMDGVDDWASHIRHDHHDHHGHDTVGDFDPGQLPRRSTATGLKDGLSKVGHGLKGSVSVVEKTGQGILGATKFLQRGVNSELEQTGGFDLAAYDDNGVGMGTSSRPATRDGASSRRQLVVRIAEPTKASKATMSPSSDFDPATHTNTTRKVANWDDVLITEDRRWWQFWRPPSGAYLSPVPQGYEDSEYTFDGASGSAASPTSDKAKKNKTGWQKFCSALPFLGGGDEDEPVEYPDMLNPDYHGDDQEEETAVWTKWLSKSDRPTHRLPLFEWTPTWLPGLPLIHKKVDTIYYCRKELARLNMEIEEDQQNPERYPTMNSAFIQFNHQVAAHMACQSVTHHVPKQMAPRVVEVSPDDVIWDNMAIRWWDQWLRTAVAIGVVFGMTILWAFPVAFTSSLAQIDSLVKTYPWLGFLESNQVTYNVSKAVAGVLPALLLSLLLVLVPVILGLLAEFQGAKTGSQKAEYVQIYYFFFLFVQVFLVVSIASGAITTLQDTVSNVQSVPQILAKNLPKAANYFFSYMILQALSTSSGTLLQINVLLVWYILARVVDDTARSKWKRQTTLPSISWGSFFPVYTNFACIALVYSVIAPLISLFAIITFALLWVANIYNMLYVTRFKIDTGGVLYPRAINQTFTGLYFMELCLVGLFFLVRDEHDEASCVPQAIIMIVVLVLTALYQIMLNLSFGPLLRYLPITFEDEAVLRDEAFQRAQDRRLGLVADDGDEDNEDEASSLTGQKHEATATASHESGDSVELKPLNNGPGARRSSFGLSNKLNPVRGMVHAGTWAARGGAMVRRATLGKTEESTKTAAGFRRTRRQRDLEAQRAIGEALYGGYNDEIEDLTAEERDVLVREAFKHSALRARRPTVWIPRDDIGVSDDEIRHTRHLSEYIWISNEGTALDSKVRVVYGRAPPDFSDIQLISL